MATFISLVNFTEQGVRNFKASGARAAKFGAMAEGAGVTVKKVYWLMGSYDAMLIMEARDDKAVVGALLGLGSLGNVRTQTLRAFDAAEMKDIVERVPKAE